MTLRSPAENENGGIYLHRVLFSIRHSRARGNPGLLCRISLDTHFRGYDGTRLSSLHRYFRRRRRRARRFRAINT
jgi:hypothetical protein